MPGRQNRAIEDHHDLSHRRLHLPKKSNHPWEVDYRLQMEHLLPLSSYALKPFSPVDYLLIGHVTQDVLPDGCVRLGGTVTFSGLTAHALGHSVGIVTACAPECNLSPLDNLSVLRVDSEYSTTFQNISTPQGRVQYLYHQATQLNAAHLAQQWLTPAIVHLGPVTAEVDPQIFRVFTDSLICLTAPGWHPSP